MNSVGFFVYFSFFLLERPVVVIYDPLGHPRLFIFGGNLTSLIFTNTNKKMYPAAMTNQNVQISQNTIKVGYTK